jgi:hypothetical protein
LAAVGSSSAIGYCANGDLKFALLY